LFTDSKDRLIKIFLLIGQEDKCLRGQVAEWFKAFGLKLNMWITCGGSNPFLPEIKIYTPREMNIMIINIFEKYLSEKLFRSYQELLYKVDSNLRI
jgi:hypothetical protein